LSLNRTEKQAVVTEVAALAGKAQTLVLAEYRGIEVEPMTRLRAQARGKGVHLQVLKNTLARRAVQGTSFEVLAEDMSGPLIYGFSEDAIAAAKVLSDFAKTNDKLVLRAGAFNGKKLDADGVKALAAIPSREELLAKLLGVMQAPLTGFVAAVAALAKKNEEAPAA
jgi:large subunit ribosomal protein L10